MIKSKFRITIPLCGLLLLSSCRTEELLHEVGQKEELSKKFITFTKKHENDVIDYGEGFKSLALRYDSIHKTNMTGRADIVKLKEELQTNSKISFSTSNEVAYIDFNVRSQLIEEENGDKWIVFPRVKGGKVENLVLALLSEEETLLSYYRISEESELYKENISKFEEVYQKKQQKNWNVRNYSYVPYFWEREIEEVIIINPRPLPRKPDLPNTGSPAPPSGISIGVGFDGDCSAFSSCGGGGSGTSTPPPPPSNSNPNNNPCEKVSKVGKHKKTKELMNRLKDATKYNKEVGYVLESNGENITSHYVEGEEGTAGINFSLRGKVDGFIHSHYTKLLSIFSVSDIFGLAQMYKNDNIRDMNTFVMGLVTDSGTQYMMVIEDPTKFANFANNLFTGNEIDAVTLNIYERIYQRTYGILPTNTSEANESAFVNYLQATGSGLKLIKGDRNMDNWKVLERGNGSPIQKDCN